MDNIPSPAMTSDGAAASTYSVPNKRIVSIEHPCIVKNFSNGFQSLGGEHQLKHVLENAVFPSKSGKKIVTESVAGVSLRPNDPFAKKFSSTGLDTQNVLIKVTVPKRTGRKRKRGSDEPFSEASHAKKQSDSITAPQLLERLRDNADRYSIQPIGMIRDTHRFRDLPDFQVRADEVPIMRELRDHAMDPRYDKLKAFHINHKPWISGTTAFPAPPSFVANSGNHSYEKQRAEQLEPRIIKKRAPKKLLSTGYKEQGFSLGTDDVPQGPPAVLPSTRGDLTVRAIAALKVVLDERPIVSKRVFRSLRPGFTDYAFRGAIPHVGYFVHSGPWQGTIVKYGVDPRLNSDYRIYQTIMISHKGINEVRDAHLGQDQPGAMHVFDGKTVPGDGGNLWQLCDLTDPILHDLVHTDDHRRECELQQWGWYHNGTIAKIRLILRDKMYRPVKDGAHLPDADYEVLAALPNEMHNTECHLGPLKDYPHLRSLGLAIARDAVYRNSEKRGDEQEQAENGSNGEVDAGAIIGDEDDEYIDGEAGAENDGVDMDNAGGVERMRPNDMHEEEYASQYDEAANMTENELLNE